MMYFVDSASGDMMQYIDVIEHFDGEVVQARGCFNQVWEVGEVEFLDLMDLIQFQKYIDEPIIISGDSITIYDDYIE